MYIFAITDKDYEVIKGYADRRGLSVIDYIKLAVDELISADKTKAMIETKEANKGNNTIIIKTIIK